MFSFAHTLSNRRHSSLTRAGAACAGRAPSPPRRVELLPQSYGSSRPALFKSAGTMTACSQSPKATSTLIASRPDQRLANCIRITPAKAFGRAGPPA